MKTESACLINNMFMEYILKIFRHPHGVHLLQILVGSHKVGRIDHVKIGDQVGADLERLAQVEKFCPLLHVEVSCSSTTFNQNSEYFTLHVYHKRFFFSVSQETVCSSTATFYTEVTRITVTTGAGLSSYLTIEPTTIQFTNIITHSTHL